MAPRIRPEECQRVNWMRTIPKDQLSARMRVENPWWDTPHQISRRYRDFNRPREYLTLFMPLLQSPRISRAVVLLGPRRVGKTVLIHHAIQQLIDSGISPNRICYVSVDHPIYNGLRLEELLELFVSESKARIRKETCYVFFDEIQYLRDWWGSPRLVDTWFRDSMPRLRSRLGSGSPSSSAAAGDCKTPRSIRRWPVGPGCALRSGPRGPVRV